MRRASTHWFYWGITFCLLNVCMALTLHTYGKPWFPKNGGWQFVVAGLMLAFGWGMAWKRRR